MSSSLLLTLSLLLPRFVGFHLVDNLIRFFGQYVNVVVHQLAEKPPIIILRYTFHQEIGVLTLPHRTTTSWTVGVGAKIEAIHITLNLRCLHLYIPAIAQLHCWHLVAQSPHIELHLYLAILLQLIPQHLRIFFNAILLLQWPHHREENGRPHNSVLLLPWCELCRVIWCLLCTVDNPENLLLL